MSNANTTGANFLRINYGINRRLRGRKFEHRNGKMRVTGIWLDDATRSKIMAIIQRRHPGWSITGWCLANAAGERLDGALKLRMNEPETQLGGSLEPVGSAAPICPRCRINSAMQLNLSMLNWWCSSCSTYWDANYLNGWNDGLKAAQPNDQADRRPDAQGRTEEER